MCFGKMSKWEKVDSSSCDLRRISGGPWSQVGVAVDLDFPGTKPISNMQGLKALDYALRSNQTQLVVWNLDSLSAFHKSFPVLSKYLAVDKKPADTEQSEGNQAQTDFWESYKLAQSQAEKLALVKDSLQLILRRILELPESEFLEENLTFQKMGLDSLMFIEFSNGLRSIFGGKTRFSSNWLKENNKLAPMAKYVVESLGQSETVDEEDEQKRVNALIRKDSQLPPHITPKTGQAIGKVKDIKTMLLLGATGALGPYLLQSLTQLQQVKEVICLVRNGGIELLLKVLEELDLLSKVELGKIRCVNGDVSLPHLGMEREVWKELSESVDAIVNSAAAVDHMEIDMEGVFCRFRAVNVEGTKHVLEFAVEHKPKRVFHSSTILSATNVDPNDGTLSEGFPNPEDFDNVTTLAYINSKFVGELLIKEAVERGIPCSVFRYPFISGHSETGRMSLENNHIMQRYIFILKTGIIPSDLMPMPMIPVDTCAKLSVRIFFSENNNSSVNENFMLKFIKTAPLLKGWRKENETYLASKTVSQLVPNAFREGVTTMDFLYKDLQFAKDIGWLD